MLRFLKINDFLLFKSQEVNFSDSFTVITGETGSGKSMLIKALSFVIGGKQDNLSEHVSITAEFDQISNLISILEEAGIPVENDSLMIRRTINKIFINDIPVTLKYLKKISEELVEFHSQSKQLEAFNKTNSLNIIDQFLNTPQSANQVSNIYSQIHKIENEIGELQKQKIDLALDKEYIEHGLKELKALNLKEGEELELIEKKRIFTDKMKTINSLEELLQIFKNDNLILKLIKYQKNLSRFEITDLNETIENAINALNEVHNLAEDKLNQFHGFEFIEEIENRLSKIKELSRKYRCTSNSLITLMQDFESNNHKLQNIDKNIKVKLDQKENLANEYFLSAKQLSEQRKIAVKLIESKVLKELKHLNLAHVEFQIELSLNGQKIHPKGLDLARFLIKTNKGFDFAEINDIASGGELSRIMLAFKVALAEKNKKNTIIFDEIDSGTGGAVAEIIGNRLKALSTFSQIISISHQPQVAAKSAKHLLIKKTTNETSQAYIYELDLEEKTQEIARMLSGINISDLALKAAKDLIIN